MVSAFDNWETELYHHGTKGQKWGVRNYQNADGTLTELALGLMAYMLFQHWSHLKYKAHIIKPIKISTGDSYAKHI